MLAIKYSLKGEKSFRKVEEEGQIYQSDSFGIAYLKRDDNETSKFGFIVSNKISPDATQRNRAKRALKEAVRHGLTDIKTGYDIVFLAKQIILRKTTDVIMKEVTTALCGAGLNK